MVKGDNGKEHGSYKDYRVDIGVEIRVGFLQFRI